MDPDFPYAWLKEQLALSAAEGVYFGTSSWKYPGWCGTVYDEQRYLHRGKFSNARFERDCLEEYSQLFPTVCVDAAYYTFPTKEGLLRLADQTPDGFRFSFKVTDHITIRRFPELPRFGPKAGKVNPFFLDAGLFVSAFLAPMESIRDKAGLMMFEFSKFHPGDFERGRDFVEALDGFLGALPKGWNYGVEMRNRDWLRPEYLEMLSSHGVTHIFNSWSDMPAVEEQLEVPGSVTRADCLGARLLLKPGRKYQDAVDAFSPYESVREPQEGVRRSAKELARRARVAGGSPRPTGFIYVNNRLEGHAPTTIVEIMRREMRAV